jgi:hypothetical protein
MPKLESTIKLSCEPIEMALASYKQITTERHEVLVHLLQTQAANRYKILASIKQDISKLALSKDQEARGRNVDGHGLISPFKSTSEEKRIRQHVCKYFDYPSLQLQC